MNRIIPTWTILSLRSCYYKFSKLRYSEKNHKRQHGLIHIVLSQNFQQSSKDNTAQPILSSQGFFINFHQKLTFYYAKIESGTIWVDPYCPFRKIRLTFTKIIHGSFLRFSNISSIFWLSDNTVKNIVNIVISRILYIVFSRIQHKLPPKAQIFFGVQKFIKNVIRDNRIWPILSFQGCYRNFHLNSDIFCSSNNYLKTVSGTLQFDQYCPSKDLIQSSTKSPYFHGVQKPI